LSPGIQGAGVMNKYNNPGPALIVGKIMRDMKKMTAELKEHRYYFEKNVAQRTEHLLKRIAVLEFCNATLCGKLALSQKEIIALQSAQSIGNVEPADCT
jgi:hypothetical protein